MKIIIEGNVKEKSCDILVVNQFQGEKTTEELANKYAIEEDKFEEGSLTGPDFSVL